MHAVTLYHYPFSNCSQKVRLALAEKGVAWGSVVVDISGSLENLSPRYLKLNPAGVVPTLVHEGEVVTDSARILRYIDQVFVGPSLSPVDSNAHARMEAWIQRQDDLPMGVLTFGRAPGALGRGMSKAVGQRELGLVYHRRMIPAHAGTYDDKLNKLVELKRAMGSPSATQQAVDEVDRVLTRLNVELSQHRWIAGDTYSLADVAWTPVAARLEFLGLASRWASERPHLHRWYQAARRRPSFREAGVVSKLQLRVFGPIVARAALDPAVAAAAALVLLFSLWPAILG